MESDPCSIFRIFFWRKGSYFGNALHLLRAIMNNARKSAKVWRIEDEFDI